MRKIFTLFLTFLCLFVGLGTSVFAAAPAVYSGAGTGTAADPYQITTAAELDLIRNFLGDKTVNFKLMNDIDLTGITWVPVGSWGNSPYGTIFLGTLDGNGHTINNIVISKSANDCGFFAGLNGPAIIKNLGFTGANSSVTGQNSIGMIAGFANVGTILTDSVKVINCYSTVNILGTTNVGGFFGSGPAVIRNSYTTGTITGTGTNGGLVGSGNPNISLCYTTGNIASTGDQVGGIVGGGKPAVNLSYSTGNITTTAGQVGGIVGSNNGAISKCFSRGVIKGGNEKVGGICGVNNTVTASISNCYSTGNIVNTSLSEKNGGITGEIYDKATVKNCYATGNVTADRVVGGIAGLIWDASSSISNCIALNGTLQATIKLNRIISAIGNNGPTLVNNYSFIGIQIAGLSNTSIPDVGKTTVNGLLLNKSEALAHATYETLLGWDFVNTWEWTSAGFPTLKGLANQPNSLPSSFMPTNVSSMVLNGSTTTVGLTSQMYASVLPSYADDLSVTWSVSDGTIASIDASGILTGIKEGNVIVTATSVADNTIKQTLSVNIIKPITGSGTLADPYKIFSAYDLLQVGNFLNNANVVFQLQNDIDMSIASSWTPIGGANLFSGTLDGNGFAIKNLVINTSNNNTGLFTSLVGPATIKNLGFIGENSSVKGASSVGAIAGLVNIGPASAKVLITNCYSTINVVGIADKVGGLVGSGEVSISKCFTTGNVTGSGGRIGGIVGYLFNTGSITDCYTAGDVQNLVDSWDVGGVAGGIDNTSAVTNCYSTGKVTGTASASGIVGTNWKTPTTTNCIALNSGLNGLKEVNRIIASPQGGTVANCYSFINIPITGRDGTSKTDVGLATVNGQGLTKKELNLPATYTDKLGWDLTTIWEFSTYGLPILKGMSNQPTSMPAHLVSYDVASIAVTGDNSIVSLLGTVQLTGTILPANSDDATITWTIDKPEIATVSATGLVQSITNGVVVVTATSNMDNTKVATTTITITNQVPITAVVVNGKDAATTISTLAGKLTMIATTTPVVPDANAVTWTVDKPEVATIDATGVLTAVSNGVVEVKGTYIGNELVFGKATITVSNQSPMTALTIKGTDDVKVIKTLAGTLTMLVATTTPATPDDASVTWSVDKPTIATIDAVTGVLTAVANGNVIVSATSKANAAVVGTLTVTISNQSPITAITVKGTGDATTITTLAGKLTMLVVTTPTVPDVATITWSVDKTSIATISATTGVLTAVSNGTVKVTATSKANAAVTGSLDIVITGQGTSVATLYAEALSVYPNPVSDDLNLLGVSAGTEVKIYSTAGILVKAIKFTGEAINVSDLNKGVYFIKVNNSITKLVKK